MLIRVTMNGLRKKFSDMDETRISGKHILLAEDNDLNAEIAEFILEDMGLIVERVEDGVQCVSRIEQNRQVPMTDPYGYPDAEHGRLQGN